VFPSRKQCKRRSTIYRGLPRVVRRKLTRAQHTRIVFISFLPPAFPLCFTVVYTHFLPHQRVMHEGLLSLSSSCSISRCPKAWSVLEQDAISEPCGFTNESSVQYSGQINLTIPCTVLAPLSSAFFILVCTVCVAQPTIFYRSDFRNLFFTLYSRRDIITFKIITHSSHSLEAKQVLQP
jgi:hypothetical protein